MSQKSILSFFKKSEGDTKTNKEITNSVTTSKKATKRKRSSIDDKNSKIKDTKKTNGIVKVKQEKNSEPKSTLNGNAEESPLKQKEDSEPIVKQEKDSKSIGTLNGNVEEFSLKEEKDSKSVIKQEKNSESVKQEKNSDPTSASNDTAEELPLKQKIQNDFSDGDGAETKDSSQSCSKRKKADVEFSPVKTSKRKRVQQMLDSDEEDNDLNNKEDKTHEKSTDSVITNVSKDEEKLASEKVKNIEINKDSSTSDYIPKRKTARKQVKSSKTINKEIKKEPEEENLKSESDNVCSLTEEKAKADHSDEKDSEDSPKKSKHEETKKESIHPFFKTEKKSDEDKVQKPNSKNKTKSSSSSNVLYDPSKDRYHPIDDAFWKHSEKVPYLALAKTLEFIENTSARLKITEILSNFFRSVIVLSPDDLLQCVYLCLNRLAPEYEGIELGVGEALLMRAVAQATGRTFDKIKAEVGVKGDLGTVAESSRGNQKLMFTPPKLTVSSVFSKFKEIAQMSGNSAMAKKTDKIQALFVACRDCEAKYIIRTLSGKLRIGLAEQTVLAALGRAATLTPPGQVYPPEILDASSKKSSEKFKEVLDAKILTLKTTYCECPNYDIIIPILLREGIDGLPKHCQLCPGRPLKPMLAHPTTSVEEVLKRFDNNEFTCEFKYDGERAQIHMTDNGEVSIYSRNQENNVSKYPDVIARLPKIMKEGTKAFILDSEIVAWDSQSKQILPFTVLSTRKRKDAVESEITVHVCVMAFDLLYLNGDSLVKKPLKERRALLHSSFDEIENEFMFVTYKDGNSAETMQEFLDESVKGNCEGLMIKALETDASYEIAKRSHNWLKLKKDYLNGVGDTLDLLVIGGYFGKGKRTGTYGGFLLACYDVETDEYQTICKLGVGFKDEDLETHTKFFKQHIIEKPKSYYSYDPSLEPDSWFEPVQIWEIKCADMSISPVHKAASGIVDPVKGISLRFPRYIRIRDDKTKPEDATSSSQVAKMYQNQSQIQNMKKTNQTEEDYY
ncbi:DNA ligase 1-like [Uloborus diversus]|uniref:DNA ligase 1-like n=1 Tax=Uloborus diversus TaxID=327109 RepID=UPI00240A9831|nr:DNA ligase 1-like [Uloborus diversus]